MKQYDINEIGAEMLLNRLYPEMEDKWIARCEGTFYRNYMGDHISVYDDSDEVVLSRDGFISLLPDGLLSGEEDLRGGNFADKYKKLTQRMKLYKEAFLPIDTFAFRQRLHIEQMTSALLENKLAYLLKSIWNYDIEAETNPYVREVAVMLPYVSKMRANLRSIAKLLGSLFDCRAMMKTGRYSHEDSTRYWIPSVEYQLLIPNLTAEQYKKLKADIEPLQTFLSEWLIPAAMRCEITIKHHRQPQKVGDGLMLSYNSEL